MNARASWSSGDIAPGKYLMFTVACGYNSESKNLGSPSLESGGRYKNTFTNGNKDGFQWRFQNEENNSVYSSNIGDILTITETTKIECHYFYAAGYYNSYQTYLLRIGSE